jgi:hypothetical protein
MSKAQAIAQQLNLTPQQKEKILPILAAEVPKVHAIKNDNSLSTMQKNATTQGYSSADRSSDEGRSFA